MTTTFADYCATADAREQIAANVLEWTQMLCLALEQDFLEESIKRAHFFSASGDNAEYWENRIADYKAGKDLYKFTINTCRKYHKIIMETSDGSSSVHAFVDKKTGELYNAASFKAPAKGGRCDLRIIAQREHVLENCDWAGGYLYQR